ncbi:hypothetical protein DFH28DRAFT_1222655 [Melampsora americana]|nr:hypothetical protein DFH28DRAFT_1222655 [Melampsora americana]
MSDELLQATMTTPFKTKKRVIDPVKARSPTLGFAKIYVVHLQRRVDCHFQRQLEGWPISPKTTTTTTTTTTPYELGFRRHSMMKTPSRTDQAFFLDQSSPMTGDLESLARHVGWKPDLIFLADAYALQSDPSWNFALPVISSHSISSIVQHRSNEGSEPDYYRFNRRQQFREGGMAEERLRHWWNVLSDAAIACWHSHLSVIREFVESKERMALILEDDVDFEVDIEDRLEATLSEVPRDWDLLLLGHCWSQESQFSSIFPGSSLRPAFAPKCNHAYAVSKRGARRLLRHLRSPAFAYSRSFDKAILHLILTERIKAFSFYPSIVVQTKDLISDIAGGNGSSWKDSLENSALSAAGISLSFLVSSTSKSSKFNSVLPVTVL